MLSTYLSPNDFNMYSLALLFFCSLVESTVGLALAWQRYRRFVSVWV